MHSISQWNFARSPNYNTNNDMIYPYSEVPYIGNYKLVKIPIATDKIIVPSSELVEHVDYWGEGRISVHEGASGFTNCYNVNHQYQLVSNGPDRDRKIPNRVPVISYINCDTSSYIKDNSVKLITLMGAPMNRSCAADIARMVSADFGKVVVYGFSSNAKDVRNLEEELAKKNVLFCEGYKLPELLNTVTLFEKDDHRAYLNIIELREGLYQNIMENLHEKAISICKILENSDNASSIIEVMTRLLKEGNRNMMTFAYKLWKSDSQNIVSKYFPIPFKLILNKDIVKIMNKKDLFTLRLDVSNNEYVVIGDGKDKESPKVRWKTEAVVENDILYFKIINADTEMFLTMEGGDENTVKVSTTVDAKSQWFLDPIKVDDDFLFFIVNREYNQALKLDENSNERGFKRLLGYKGSVYEEPLSYGWYIAPW